MEKKTYPDDIIQPIQLWLRNTETSHPWHQDPKVLVVVERHDFCDICLIYLASRLGSIVTLDSKTAYTDIELWKRSLKKSQGMVLFLRGFNFLSPSEQQSLWASWLNSRQPGDGLSRFAVSIHPFDETADELDKMTHDLIPKLDDLAVIVRQRNEKSE